MFEKIPNLSSCAQPFHMGAEEGTLGYLDFSRDTLDFGAHLPRPVGYDDNLGMYIWSERRHTFRSLIVHVSPEQWKQVKFLRLGMYARTDFTAEWLAKKVFSNFPHLNHITFVEEDKDFDRGWRLVVENAIASKKVEDPAWTAPTW